MSASIPYLGKARCRIIGGVTVRIICHVVKNPISKTRQKGAGACGLLFLPMPRYSSIPARLPLIFVRELELLLPGHLGKGIPSCSGDQKKVCILQQACLTNELVSRRNIMGSERKYSRMRSRKP